MKLRQFLPLVLAALVAQDALAAEVEILHPPAGKQTSLSRLTTDAGGKLYYLGSGQAARAARSIMPA